MAKLFSEEVRALMLRSESIQRFMQDSPIFGDVWLAYAELLDKPPADGIADDRVDLLLTPHRDSSPAALAMEIRERLRRDLQHRVPGSGNGGAVPSYRLSYNDTQVVVRLSFGELIRIALPLTKWWQKYVCRHLSNVKAKIDSSSADGVAESKTEEADLQHREMTSLERVACLLGDKKLLNHLIFYVENPGISRTTSGDAPTVSADLLWMIRIVGTIARKLVERRKTDVHRPAQLIQATRQLIDGGPLPDPQGYHLWSVSLNRRVTISATRSMATIKADAARMLFTPKCNDLCWAVLDSGIDARHIAFRKRKVPSVGDEQVDPPFVKRGKNVVNNTRVLHTYDFTRFRELLEIPIGIAGDQLEVDEGKESKAIASRLALMGGRMLPWDDLADVLRVSYTPDEPEKHVPKIQHGTHVAGILAADWRATDEPPSPGVGLQGVCPDINLYDLRVVDDQATGAEFSVLAALQFIRFVNSGKDQPVIHGVNISMSIPHDVANYACGRTPICDECDRLVGSGVVVVAAAGNLGYTRFTTDQGVRSDGYRAVSITDPGNAELAITVGATHRTHPHRYGVSYFSSRGPTGDGRAKPDLLAPGEKIMAPVPNGDAKALDGTSMAAPHVSGAAALLMARHPELMGRPAEIKRILCSTATDLGRTREFQGAGMLDVLRALQSV